jgi:hypothetical protein
LPPQAIAADHAGAAQEDEGRTVARIGSGIAGWLTAVLPLVVVNIVGALVFSTGETATASGVALLVGPVLGGIAVGLLSEPDRRGLRGMAGTAGGIAALLYFVSLLGLILFALGARTVPQIAQEHPLRAGAVLAGLAAALAGVLLAVALAVGAWSARRLAGAQDAASWRGAAPAPRSAPYRAADGRVRPGPVRGMAPGSRPPRPPSRGDPGYRQAGRYADRPTAARQTAARPVPRRPAGLQGGSAPMPPYRDDRR